MGEFLQSLESGRCPLRINDSGFIRQGFQAGDRVCHSAVTIHRTFAEWEDTVGYPERAGATRADEGCRRERS
jgi:hypothetical protein